MSGAEVKKKLSTGATLRPPLHRSSSDSSIQKPSEVESKNHSNVSKSTYHSSTQDCSANARELLLIKESSSRPSELKDTHDQKDQTELSDCNDSEYSHSISNVDTGDGYDEVDEDFDESTNENKPCKDQLNTETVNPNDLTHQYNITMLLFVSACLVFLSAVFQFALLQSDENSVNIDSIKHKFPTQDESLWIAFESGVQDVIIMNRPSTFILLYKEDAEDIVTALLHEISKYATCNIRHCRKEPIEITPAELNSAEVVRDYGTIIDKYRDKLEDCGVMIIRNLETVRGTSAQAFHSFCDEFTPLVQRSFFIFTVKVDEQPSSTDKMKFIEQYLKEKWTDIKIDTLNALITRITSMVLQIQA